MYTSPTYNGMSVREWEARVRPDDVVIVHMGNVEKRDEAPGQVTGIEDFVFIIRMMDDIEGAHAVYPEGTLVRIPRSNHKMWNAFHRITPYNEARYDTKTQRFVGI